MATHDYDLANQSGASFRADLNNALQAILTNNSSATEPATTGPYMFWADTNSNKLKIRNAADNAWVTLFSLDEDGLLTSDDIGTDVQAYDAGLAFLAGLTFTDEAEFKAAVNLEIGTDVQAYDANTAKTDVAQTFTAGQSGAVPPLSSTSNSVAIDLADSNNFSLDMTENTTLAAPSNATEGQPGIITITQDASTAYTLAYNTFWKFEGGTVPALSETLSSVNTFVYYVNDGGTSATCNLIGEVS